MAMRGTTGKPSYVRLAAPRIVSQGSVSRPRALPKWAPKAPRPFVRVREVEGNHA